MGKATASLDGKMESLVTYTRRLAVLKELPRVGWIMEGARRSEADSVAAHSFMVSAIALRLAGEIASLG